LIEVFSNFGTLNIQFDESAEKINPFAQDFLCIKYQESQYWRVSYFCGLVLPQKLFV
jgi:hypothetical protein